MSSSGKFDFPYAEVLITQTITMPMTTEYTRQLFEGDSSDDESMTSQELSFKQKVIEAIHCGYGEFSSDEDIISMIENLLIENRELKDDNAELTTEKQKAMEPWLGDDWEETTLADWADDIEKQKAEITDDSQREIEALKEEIEELQTSLKNEQEDLAERSHEYDILSALYEKLRGTGAN